MVQPANLRDRRDWTHFRRLYYRGSGESLSPNADIPGRLTL